MAISLITQTLHIISILYKFPVSWLIYYWSNSMKLRKVYSILMLQLVITFGIMSIFVFINDVRQYSMDHPEIYYSALGIYIGLTLILSCCGDIRRRAPVNIILLGLLTASMGLMLGSIAAYFSVCIVILYWSHKHLSNLNQFVSS